MSEVYEKWYLKQSLLIHVLFNPLTFAAAVVDDKKNTIFELSAIYGNQMTSKGQLIPARSIFA